MSNSPSAALIRAIGLRKAFDGVEVVRGVDLEIRAGEIHALVGENGAGKSTVGKMLAGVHAPDRGRIEIAGSEVRLENPRDGLSLGVALIHQEPLTFPDLTVAENVFVGHQPLGRTGVDWSRMRSEAESLLKSLGAEIRPETRAAALSVADQQMVELAAALSYDARVLLMDEPTAALTPAEAAKLFQVMRRLCEQARGILFVSHHLEEVVEVADRITVMRDGEKVAELDPQQTSVEEIVRLMVGRELAEEQIPDHRIGPDPILKVNGLSVPGRFSDVSLEVRPGEIVGVAGLVGAGRTDVCRALFGILRPGAGTIEVDGKPITISNPRQAIESGIAMVPEDRRQEGLLMPLSVGWNATLSQLWSGFATVDPRAEVPVVNEIVQRLGLVCRGAWQPVRELSGGNQQKVVLGKWLLVKPRILLLDEPTRGIDVGAKAEVHRAIGDLAAEGLAVLLVSSDLPELLKLSDRILVMRKGRLVAELSREQATEETVMMAAATSAQPSDLAQTRGASSIGRVSILRESGVGLLCLALVAFAALRQPRFLDPTNLESIMLWVPLLAAVGFGQMLVIVTRGIDVSVGSMVGMAAMVVGMSFRSAPHLPIALGVLIGVGVGAILGSLNGVLVAGARVPPIIATLGTLSLYRGAIFIVSQGRQIDSYSIPDALTRWSSSGPFSIAGLTFPWILLMVLEVAAIWSWIVKRTPAGRNVFALGSNPEAAALRGLSTRRTTFGVYAATGALCGLAGVLYASRYGFANPATAGAGLELTVIAAVVIGGTNVLGGSGTVLGVLLGCLFLAILNQALAVLGVAENWQQFVYGVVILLTVLLDTALRSLMRKREAAG